MGFLTPGEIADYTLQAGIKKANQTVSNMVALGILAGAFIAFAAQGSTMAMHDLPLYGAGKYLAGIIFGTGLMMVVMCGAELFTGNTLIYMGVLHGKVTWGGMLRNWFWVYLGNFFGSILLVYLMANSGLWNVNHNLVGAVTLKTAVAKVNLTFTQAFIRGILCNWLVCLAVWLAYGAKDITGKIFGIFFPIMLFVTSGFEHSIANMYYIPAGIFAKMDAAVLAASGLGAQADTLTWLTFLFKNLIPVTLGNIVGGAFFVGFFYWFTYLRPIKAALPQENTKTM